MLQSNSAFSYIYIYIYWELILYQLWKRIRHQQ